MSTFLAHLKFLSSPLFLHLLFLSFSILRMHEVAVNCFSTFLILCHCPTPSALCTGQRFYFSVLFLTLKLQTLLQCPNIKVITERAKVKSIHCCLSFCSARSIQESNTQNFQLSLESRKRWVRSFLAVTRNISGHAYHACSARR